MANPCIQTKIEGGDRLTRQLAMLALPPETKKRYLGRMGRFARLAGQTNIKQQKDVEGKAFQPRKGISVRRLVEKNGQKYMTRTTIIPQNAPMLVNLPKSKLLGVFVDPFEATVTYPNQVTGAIALRHQKGLSFRTKLANYPVLLPPDVQTRILALKQVEVNGRPGATPRQILKLVRLGVRNDPSTKQPLTPEEMISRFTKNQAIYLIATYSKRVGQTEHATKTPARPYLGLNHTQIVQLGDYVLESIGNRVISGKEYRETLKNLNP